MAAEFHALLQTKLDALAINPFEAGDRDEVKLASQRHAALQASLADPEGMPRLLANDRARERYRAQHTRGERAWRSTLHVATFGAVSAYGKAAEPEIEQARSPVLNVTPDVASQSTQTQIPEPPEIVNGATK